MAFAAPLLPLLSSAAPLIGIAGTLMQASSTAKANNYQAAVLDRQATRDAWNGQIEVQDQGLSASQQIGQALAQQGASGLSINSPSALRRQALLQTLARRDVQRIGADTAVKVSNGLADAAQSRGAARNAWIEGALGVGTDLINNATMVSKRKADSLQYDSRGVTNG